MRLESFLMWFHVLTFNGWLTIWFIKHMLNLIYAPCIVEYQVDMGDFIYLAYLCRKQLFELSFDSNGLKNVGHWLGLQIIARGILINLWHMLQRVTVDILCLCVCYHFNCHLPYGRNVWQGKDWQIWQIINDSPNYGQTKTIQIIVVTINNLWPIYSFAKLFCQDLHSPIFVKH